MSKIAIIPARGGSRRIPRKNIKDFLGKPIIQYSIETALKSELFDEVMVSTDDEEIAGIAKRYGASVPFMRSAQNSDDYATTLDVINEVLDQYRELGQSFDYTCCIYPTAPFVQIDQIKAGFEKLQNQDLDSVFPVVPFSYPIWRGLRKDENQHLKMLWPEYYNTRSQDLEVVYHDAGQWYWLRNGNKISSIFGERSGGVVLKATEVQDIDNLTDWNMAQLKYRFHHDESDR